MNSAAILAKVIKDLAGLDRVVIGRLNNIN